MAGGDIEKITRTIPDLAYRNRKWKREGETEYFWLSNERGSRAILSLQRKPLSSSLELYNQYFFQDNRKSAQSRSLILGVSEEIFENSSNLVVRLGVVDKSIGGINMVSYDEKDGGNKSIMHVKMFIDDNSERRRLYLDLYKINDLPEIIKVRETAIAFIEQVKARNFSKPQLILP